MSLAQAMVTVADRDKAAQDEAARWQASALGQALAACATRADQMVVAQDYYNQQFSALMETLSLPEGREEPA